MSSSSSIASRQITVFSEEGDLHQIEYAKEAVRRVQTTALGVQGKDSVVLICQRRIQSAMNSNIKLIDPDSIRAVRVYKNIAVCNVGEQSHSQFLFEHINGSYARSEVRESEVPTVRSLAESTGDLHQLLTQYSGLRLCAVDSMFGGFDDGEPVLYTTDCSGLVCKIAAAAIGTKQNAAQTSIKKMYDKLKLEDEANTIMSAIALMQKVMESSLDPGLLEIVVITKSGIRSLQTKEIEYHLGCTMRTEEFTLI